MSFHWRDYLTFAKTLADSKDDASLRTAISRAYYCAFNMCLYRAKLNEFRTKDDADSHMQLWWLYGRNDNRTCAKINAIGTRMKRRRVSADYHLVYGDLEAEAKDVIADAELCVSLLESLPGNLPENIGRAYHR